MNKELQSKLGEIIALGVSVGKIQAKDGTAILEPKASH